MIALKALIAFALSQALVAAYGVVRARTFEREGDAVAVFDLSRSLKRIGPPVGTLVAVLVVLGEVL